MRKIEIAHRVHQEAGIPEPQAATLVDWVFELFKTTLQKGEPISIPNFGVFTVRNKTSRTGRNPRTGEEIIIAPRRVVIFRASPQLKAAVSAVDAEPQDSSAEGEVKPILPVATKGNHVIHPGDRSEA